MSPAAASPPFDWAEALRACVAADHPRAVVVRGDVLLVRVASEQAAAHPLLALLPRGFVLVLRLRACVTALLQRLMLDEQQQEQLLQTLVFDAPALDVASGQPAYAVATCVLRSLAADEAHGKAALADVAHALQNKSKGDDDDNDEQQQDVVVVVEHDTGYAGLAFTDGGAVTRTIRVDLAPFDDAAATLDDVLEAYEDDYRDQMELRGVDDAAAAPQLEVRVRAGFAVSGSEPLGALLLSSWGGVENIRALRCKPPPSSSSLLCIGTLPSDFIGSEPSVGKNSASTRFPTQLQEVTAFLTKLGNSVGDEAFEWRNDDAQPQDVEMEDTELVRKFVRFLSSPGATPDDSVDLNSTLELNLALDFDRADEVAKSRSDLDFLEKMWDFVFCSARSADAAVALVRECVATFATARTIPFVHLSNDTRLGKFLKARAAATEDRAAEALRGLQTQLLGRQYALCALIELGEWKLRRDVAAWLVQIGFTAAESLQVVEQFEMSDIDADPSGHTHTYAAVQQLVDVCALAHSLGTSGVLLRKLANDCLRHFAKLDNHEAESEAPLSFVLPLSSFIPERTRANLRDALFWDMEMSFGALMGRTVCICDAAFHRKCLAFSSHDDENAPALAPKKLEQLRQQLSQKVLLHPDVVTFMQQAEKAYADKLPTPTGLVQLNCTVRSLMH